MTTRKLRKYQEECLQISVAKAAEGVLRQLSVLATGTGKSVLFSNLSRYHNAKGRVLVLVDQEELAAQAAKRIALWNPEPVGIEMAGSYAKPTDKFVVASVQTLSHSDCRRLKAFDPSEFSIVCADEAHKSVSDTWSRVFEYFGLLQDNPHKILLWACTATPQRTDNVALGSVYDQVIYNYGIIDAVKDGYLVEPRGFRISTSTSLDSVPMNSDDFSVGALSDAINTPYRNKVVVDGWLKHGDNRKTLVFSATVQHAKDLAAAFCKAGISADYVHGSDAERKEKIEKLRNGDIKVLVNCALLTTGFDEHSVSCIVFARPTKSALLYTQILGRGLRIPDGCDNLIEAMKRGEDVSKRDCICLDVFDSTSKHSLQSIPSVMGLPPKMDLKGKGAIESLEKFTKTSVQYPLADLGKAVDIDNIEVYAQSVDLMTVTYPNEVLNNSEFTWLLRHDGVYMLTLPNKGWVTIKPTLLGKYEVQGLVEGTEFGPESHDTLPEAFAFADSMVRMFGRKLINLLRRKPNARWSKDEITINQIKALEVLLRRLKMPVPNWKGYTKVEGMALYRKLSSMGNERRKGAA